MASRGVAKRYAQAVFELAEESGTHEQWLEDLSRLAAAVEDPIVGGFFTSPNVSNARKRAAIAELLPGDDRQLARNLAVMLTERQRMDSVPLLYEVFTDLVLESCGIAIANVTTAVEMSPEEAQVVRDGLKRVVGREVELRTSVDPEIIGGMVARVGDQLVDGSILSQLHRLRMQIAQ